MENNGLTTGYRLVNAGTAIVPPYVAGRPYPVLEPPWEAIVVNDDDVNPQVIPPCTIYKYPYSHCPDGDGGFPPPPEETFFILLETGDYILTESEDRFLQEAA